MMGDWWKTCRCFASIGKINVVLNTLASHFSPLTAAAAALRLSESGSVNAESPRFQGPANASGKQSQAVNTKYTVCTKSLSKANQSQIANHQSRCLLASPFTLSLLTSHGRASGPQGQSIQDPGVLWFYDKQMANWRS